VTPARQRQRPPARATAATTPPPPHQIATLSLLKKAATARALDRAVADAVAAPYGAPRQLAIDRRSRRERTRASARTAQRTHGEARARRGAARRADWRTACTTIGGAPVEQWASGRSVRGHAPADGKRCPAVVEAVRRKGTREVDG